MQPAEALRVLVAGMGRLGSSLAVAVGTASAARLVGVAWHSPADRARAERWAPGVAAFRMAASGTWPAADLVVLAVRDDAVASVAAVLAGQLAAGPAVVHTSGLLGAEALRQAGLRAPVGSFHPLQSFAHPAAGAERFRGCTVACEGDPFAVALGRRLAGALGSASLELPSAGKVAYHAAAVVASNYLVALTAMAVELLGLSGIAPANAIAMLGPLQQGALANLAEVGLPGALTGPIARGDVETVRAHLAVIDGRAPGLRAAYVALGRRALAQAREQGLEPGPAGELAALLGETDP